MFYVAYSIQLFNGNPISYLLSVLMFQSFNQGVRRILKYHRHSRHISIANRILCRPLCIVYANSYIPVCRGKLDTGYRLHTPLTYFL